MNVLGIQLSDQQRAFVSDFVPERSRRTRLIAGPGTGKTTVALIAATDCVRRGSVDSVVMVAQTRMTAKSWEQLSASAGLAVVSSVNDLAAGNGLLATRSTAIARTDQGDELLLVAEKKRLLVVLDEAQLATPATVAYVEHILALNDESRSLALFDPNQGVRASQWDSLVETEYFLDSKVLRLQPTKLEIARFAPSQSILNSLLQDRAKLDDLMWRQFEKLIAELLKADGYEVELMQGTKDGGVDAIATKDLGVFGGFKTLWQAKRKDSGGRVGLSVVRELADTRLQFGASKAFVVTSTYLTRGAIQRIERDRFTLGKVDRKDLEGWITSTLRGSDA